MPTEMPPNKDNERGLVFATYLFAFAAIFMILWLIAEVSQPIDWPMVCYRLGTSCKYTIRALEN